MADVPWVASVRNSRQLTIDASGVHGADWRSALSAAMRELNALFAASRLNVTLTLGDPAVVAVALTSGRYTFSFEETAYNGTLRSDILHGVTRSVDRQTGSSRNRERAYIFLPVRPLVNPSAPRSRAVGAPVMRVLIAHEFLHALGLDAHDPGFEGLLAGSWTVNEGASPSRDTVTPFGGSARLPPLTLSPDTVSRLRALW